MTKNYRKLSIPSVFNESEVYYSTDPFSAIELQSKKSPTQSTTQSIIKSETESTANNQFNINPLRPASYEFNLGKYSPRLLLYTSLFTTLGVLMFGFEQGVMSLLVSSESFLSHFANPSPILLGTMVAILEFSAMISALTVPYVSNTYGRRLSIVFGAVLFAIGGFFQFISPHATTGIMVMIFGRFVSGLGIGVLSSVVPLFQSEVSPVEKRGFYGCLEFTGNILGFSCSVWIDFVCGFIKGDWGWRVPLGIQAILGSVLAIGGLKLVESPRWLISKNKEFEGLTVLTKLFGPTAENQFLVMKEGIEKEKESFFGEKNWKSVVKNNWKRICVGASSLTLAQFGGINLVSYYSVIIFEKIGFQSRTAGLICAVNSVVYLGSTFIAWIFVDKKYGGRRKLFIGGGLLMGFALFGAAIGESIGNKFGSILVAILIVVYQCGFGFSWGPIAWLYNSEIYADSYTRAIGSSIGTSCNWFSNFVVGELSPELLELIGWKLYMIYGSFCFVGCLAAYIFYPETTGVELEDMDNLFDEFYGDNSRPGI